MWCRVFCTYSTYSHVPRNVLANHGSHRPHRGRGGGGDGNLSREDRDYRRESFKQIYFVSEQPLSSVCPRMRCARVSYGGCVCVKDKDYSSFAEGSRASSS